MASDLNVVFFCFFLPLTWFTNHHRLSWYGNCLASSAIKPNRLKLVNVQKYVNVIFENALQKYKDIGN